MTSNFTRRSFIKRTALAAGALSGASAFPGLNILRASEGNKLNCVLIGCGGRAMNHLESLVTQSKDNIYAIVDPDEKAHDKVKKYLQRHDCDPDKTQVFTDYRAMFDKIGK